MRTPLFLAAVLLACSASAADPNRHIVRAGQRSANPPSYERHVIRAPDYAPATRPQRITTAPNLQPLPRPANPFDQFDPPPPAPPPQPVLNPDMTVNTTIIRLGNGVVWDYAADRHYFVDRLADGRLRIREP